MAFRAHYASTPCLLSPQTGLRRRAGAAEGALSLANHDRQLDAGSGEAAAAQSAAAAAAQRHHRKVRSISHILIHKDQF